MVKCMELLRLADSLKPVFSPPKDKWFALDLEAGQASDCLLVDSRLVIEQKHSLGGADQCKIYKDKNHVTSY